jgi:transcription elongation factor GreB
MAEAKGPPPPPNYITLAGAKRLQAELGHLRSKERPKVVQEVSDAAAQGDRSENAEYIYGKRRLREIDRRMHFLTRRLEKAVIVEPRPATERKIFFGAIVVVEDEDAAKAKYQIVGEDEIDLGTDTHAQARAESGGEGYERVGRISWRSPLGRALLGKKEDDTIVFRRPGGEVEMTVLSVRYDTAVTE